MVVNNSRTNIARHGEGRLEVVAGDHDRPDVGLPQRRHHLPRHGLHAVLEHQQSQEGQLPLRLVPGEALRPGFEQVFIEILIFVGLGNRLLRISTTRVNCVKSTHVNEQ